MKRFPLLLLIGLGLLPTTSHAELKPSEIAIIAARSSRDSQSLARYYCKMRSVPEANVCLIDVPRGEVLDEDQWRTQVRPEIQRWLLENDPQEKIRCLLTLWDVPLKISPAHVGAATKRYESFLREERDNRLLLAKRIAAELDLLAESSADSSAQPPIKLALGDSSTSVGVALENSLQKTQKKLSEMPAGEERNRKSARLQQLASAAGGDRVLLQAMEQQLTTLGDRAPAELQPQFDFLRGRTSALMEMSGLLEQTPMEDMRDSLILAAVERTTGLLGTLQWLDSQLEVVRKNESGASFDSELSLVMWPDGYELLRWQPNYLCSKFDNTQLRDFNRTLMVARLDGPTLPIAKRMIDDSIAVEKAGGLQGKVYIDARGLAKLDTPNLKPGSYEDYDRALLATAKGVDEETKMEIVLNEKPELFQPGQCPDTALYCGWYSLSKYVDAFDFAPGAVAYHLASAEADTLRGADSQVWCKRLLEDGACATIGPVYEPYLAAFPRPNEFFAELLRGQGTLVETYYHTLPYNSWAMVLVGDPLYRPFAKAVDGT